MDIRLSEGKLNIHFRVNGDQSVELVSFSALPGAKVFLRPFPYVNSLPGHKIVRRSIFYQ